MDIYAGFVFIPGDVRCMKADVPVDGWPMSFKMTTKLRKWAWHFLDSGP
jgi:hypothetical protein